jgi:hypothetical protein
VECVFEELTFTAVAPADLLHLDEHERRSWRMAKREIYTPTFNRVLRRNNLSVVRWPRQRLQQAQDNALSDRRFIREPPAPDSRPYVLDIGLELRIHRF